MRIFFAITSNYLYCLKGLGSNKGRVNRRTFASFFVVYLILAFVFNATRFSLGLVSTTDVPIGNDGVYFTIGILPKFDVLSILAFFLEGLLTHLPLYRTSIKRAHDSGVGHIRLVVFLFVLLIPGVGVVAYFWLMFRKGNQGPNKYGPHQEA